MPRKKINKLGDGGKATTQDSLDVYNNAKQVDDFYRKSGQYERLPGPDHVKDLIANYNALNLEAANNFDPNSYRYTPEGKVKVPLENYRKDLDANHYAQRELANDYLNTKAPMQLFDKRIQPQERNDYNYKGSNPNLQGDLVQTYQYDPIAVKPYNMLTPKEKQIRDTKYGAPQGIQPKVDLKPIGTGDFTIAGDIPDTSRNHWFPTKEAANSYASTLPKHELGGKVMNKVVNGTGNAFKKTPKKVLNKVMPIKALNGWDAPPLPDDVTNGATATWNAIDASKQPFLYPNQNLPGVSPLYPTNDPLVQNAPMQPSDNGGDPSKPKTKGINPLAGKGIKGHFDTADITTGLLGAIDGMLEDRQKKSNIQLMNIGEQRDPYGVRGSGAMFADGGILNRDNFNALHTYAYQNAENYGGDQYNHGTYGNGIINEFNQAYPDKAIQLADVQRYQQDMLGNPQAITTANTFSPADNKYGPLSMQQSYMNYATEHYDKNNKLVPEDSKSFGTNQVAASNQHRYNIANPIQEWQSNNQNIPMPTRPSQPVVTPIQSPGKKTQKDNYHTNEDTNYDIHAGEGKSGIHIKPSHKGKFTAWKKAHHETTAQAKHSSSAAVRKMATFAQNAKKWHHEDGGDIEYDDSYDEAVAGIQMLGNGNVAAMSDSSNPMLKFTGPSHQEGGIPLKYGESGAEVQGGETAHVSPFDGSLHVDGAMKMPNFGELTKGLAGRSFQSIGNELGERENKATKMAKKATDLASISNPHDKFDGFSLGTSMALQDGASQNLKAIDLQKEHMAKIQENMRAMAEDKGIDPKKAHSMFKNGGKLKADSGAILQEQRGMMQTHPDWVQEALTKYGEPRAGKFDDGLDGPRTRFVRNYLAQKAASSTSAFPTDKLDMSDPRLFSTTHSQPTYNPIPQDQMAPNPNRGPQAARKMTSLADDNKLSLADYGPALGYLFEHPQQVVAQQYNPTLTSPYQVSFQDRMNNNQSTFNSIQRQLGESAQAGALGSLAAQKYDADNQVSGEEFRTNQGIANNVQNTNYQIMNEAAKTNLQLADQQMVRQSQAKSNTDAHRAQALASISDMIDQNRYENMNIHMVEQRSGYRWDPKTNSMKWEGPDAALAGTPGGYAAAPQYKTTQEKDDSGNWIDKKREYTTTKWGGIFR